MRYRSVIFLVLTLFLFTCARAQTDKGVKTNPAEATYTFTGKTYALIIGISKYQSSKIPQLNYADADAVAFHDFLTSAAGGKVPEQNIRMLLNDSAKIGDITDHGFLWLEDRNAKKGDRVFIYYSGHGVTIGNNNSYLLSNNIKEGFNKNNIFFLGALPVSVLKRDIIQPMTSAGVEVFLVIDACRSKAVGNENDSVKLLTSSAMIENAGDIMLISAENEQFSQEDDPANKKWGGHGVFTYYLLNGLEGMADGIVGGSKADGIVTLGELKSYLNSKVPESTDNLQMPFISEGYNKDTLCKVDAPTLAFLKQKLQKTGGDLTSAHNTHKGFALTDVDLTTQSLYTLFSEALSKDNLLGNESADYYFTKLENFEHVGGLKQEALYSLCAGLMNDGQKIINAYLNSDLSSLLEDSLYLHDNDRIFAKGEREMKRLYELREKYFASNKYNENIKARWLFMKARNWANSSNKTQLNEAREAIQQAIKIDSSQSYFYHTLAMIYSTNHNYKMAIAEEQNALTISNNWWYALFHAGLLYLDLKDYLKAEQYFLQVIQTDSTNKFVYIRLGEVYSKLKQYNKADRYFLKAIQLVSTDEDSYFVSGAAYYYLKQYDKAEQCYLKAIQLDSASTRAYTMLGATYLVLKQYDKSEQYFLKAIQLDSTCIDAYSMLGATYLVLKQYDTAEQYYLKAIQLDSTCIDAFNMLGATYLVLEQYEKARDCYLRVIQLDSSFADGYVYISLGDTYFAPEQYDKAEQCYLKAIQLDSTSANGYSMLGKTYLSGKQYDKAEQCYLKAIQLDSTSADVYSMLGKTYLSGTQYDKAEQCYLNAIELDSTDEDVYFILGFLNFSQKRYEKAEKYFLKAIQLDSTDKRAYSKLGLVYSIFKEYDKAKTCFLKIIRLDSTFTGTDVYISLGNAYFALDQYDKAEQIYLKAIQLDSTSTDAYSMLGETYFYLKQYDKAEEFDLKAIQLDSTYEDAYNDLGFLYLTLKQYNKAEQCYLKAIQLDSTFRDAYFDLGVLCYDQKRYDKAEKYYLKVVRLDSTDVSAYNKLGLVYSTLKEYDKSQQYFLKALSFNPGDEVSLYNIACLRSLRNEKQDALKYLDQSLQNGYNNYDHIQVDTDLNNIRNESEFKKLMAKYFPDKEK